MDMKNIQEQCNQFLKGLGVPGFIVIGIAEGKEKASTVYSVNEMPPKLLIKSMTNTLNDLIQRM
jgi:hypothetical protein